MEEVWKDVPSFPGYQCSNLGRVRSFKGQGRSGIQSTPHMLRPGDRPNGYRFVVLMKNGTRNNRSLHNLVMLTFVGPKPRGLEIAHNNGDKRDNRLSNLRYCHKHENEYDKVQHGTSHKQFKLDEEMVLHARNVVRKHGQKGKTKIIQELAEHAGVALWTMYDAVHGRTWRHLPNAVPYLKK